MSGQSPLSSAVPHYNAGIHRDDLIHTSSPLACSPPREGKTRIYRRNDRCISLSSPVPSAAVVTLLFHPTFDTLHHIKSITIWVCLSFSLCALHACDNKSSLRIPLMHSSNKGEKRFSSAAIGVNKPLLGVVHSTSSHLCITPTSGSTVFTMDIVESMYDA